MIVRQLNRRQRAQALAGVAHGPDILRAVREQVDQVLRRVLERRHAALPNERGAAVVFPHSGAGESSDVLKTARRAVSAGLSGRADELLQLVVGLEDVPQDEPLKRRVVGVDGPLVAEHVLRERLVGRPSDDVAVVEGVAHAQHLGRAMHGVVVNARSGQVALAAGFKINP